MKKICLKCKKEFRVKPSHNWRKYCSKKCQYSSLDFRKKMADFNRNRIMSEETKRKLSEAAKKQWREGRGKIVFAVKGHIPWNKGKNHLSATGSNNCFWKGEKASYHVKHIWVSKWFGKPQYCEHCRTTKKRMYHWANISGRYIRERWDWIRLCVPCHKKFDLNKINHENKES